MLWYMTAWLQLTREWSVLKFAAGWVRGFFFFLIHLIEGTYY